MFNRAIRWLYLDYPKSFLFLNPFAGGITSGVYSFFFLTLYTPLHINPQNSLSLTATMAIYAVIVAAAQSMLVLMVSRLFPSSSAYPWRLWMELVSCIIVLVGMGIVIFLSGFLVETSEGRMNLTTFFDSVKITFLTGFPLFFFFFAINYRRKSADYVGSAEQDSKLEIHIDSSLKKESLQFCPSDLIYVMSDGNYVVFFLSDEGQIKRKSIRNTMNNIESQLQQVPFLIRTHRAFIVNVKKVMEKSGNSLGYKLRLEGVQEEIPVSRSYIHAYEGCTDVFH